MSANPGGARPYGILQICRPNMYAMLAYHRNFAEEEPVLHLVSVLAVGGCHADVGPSLCTLPCQLRGLPQGHWCTALFALSI